jgi:hypothetical protein
VLVQLVVMIDTQRLLVIINSYLNLKTYSITFINYLDTIVWQKLYEVWESWKRSKASWMGHGAWMGPKHNFRNVTCFGGICFKGLGCPGIKMHVELCHRNLTCFWCVVVSKFLFWGSCFMACNFRPAEMNIRLSLKHDMFSCQFVLGPLLSVHANPR